jgi:glucose/arabinose dehydrogenase
MFLVRATLALVACVLAGTSPLLAALPDGFNRQKMVAAEGSEKPIGFSWLPDGRIVVIGRGGQIRLSVWGSGTSSLLTTVPDVTTDGERGLTGVAVDPDWPTRPYLYVYVTQTDLIGHLYMYTASGDLTDPGSTSITLSSPYEVLQAPDLIEIHNGGTLRFGPDGMLYLSLGDDESSCDAQDIDTLMGVVLRMDVAAMPGPGSGPPPLADLIPATGNPFPGPTDVARLVVAWGLRNPFRFTIDPTNGDLWIGEVGEDTWEEVNLLPADGFGANFGWPRREGPDPYDPGDPCGTGNVFTEPLHSIPHPVGFPISITGGPSWRDLGDTGVSLPPSYEGSYFWSDYFTGAITRLVDDGGTLVLAPPVPGQPSPTEWATAQGALVDLQQGPDGALWFCSMAFGVSAPSDGVWRIKRNVPLDAPAAALVGLSLAIGPNPAAAGQDAAIRFRGAAGPVSLRVYDAGGRLVRTLLDGASGADARTVVWRDAPAGVFFVRLETAEGSATRKLVRLR